MTKQTIVIWIVIGAVIGIAVIFFSVKGLQTLNSPSSKKLPGAVLSNSAAPGASAISKEGVVLTPEGNPTKNDVAPGSPEAPKQSMPLSKNEIPRDSLELAMSAGKITPSSFTVRTGSVVTLTISAGDNAPHVFKFRDPSLEAVAAGVSPDETRAIPFNAPSKPGEYEFYCDVPGHAARGETGKMIVK